MASKFREQIPIYGQHCPSPFIPRHSHHLWSFNSSSTGLPHIPRVYFLALFPLCWSPLILSSHPIPPHLTPTIKQCLPVAPGVTYFRFTTTGKRQETPLRTQGKAMNWVWLSLIGLTWAVYLWANLWRQVLISSYLGCMPSTASETDNNPGNALKRRGAREAEGRGHSAAKMPSLSRPAWVWSHRKTLEHELYHLTPGGQEQPLTRVPFNRWGDRRQLLFQPRAISQRTPAVSCYQLTLTAARGWRVGRWKERGRKYQQHPLHLLSDFHYTLPAALLWALIQLPIIWLMLMLANYLLLFTQTTANWVRLLTVYSLI